MLTAVDSGSTIATSAAVNSAAPPRSSRPCVPARDSGTSLRASTSAATPTGTFTQKIARQPRPATSALMSSPPRSWPPTAAMPITVP